jgi:two-component system NtrC family response regulator
VQNINLIFTDINMPHMNGIDFIRKIRLNPKLKNLDVVVISDQAALVNKAVEELNISGYVLKPFDINNFNTTITPIIERIKNNAEQKSKTKIEPQEVKTLLQNEIPQIALNRNNIALEFNNCSLTIDLNLLSDIAVFKAK